MPAQLQKVRKLLFFTLLACVFTACTSQQLPIDVSETNKAQISNSDFAEYKDKFIETLWKQNPGWALYSGYYKYDDQLNVPSAQNRITDLSNTEQALSELQKFVPKNLSATDATAFAKRCFPGQCQGENRRFFGR